MVNGRSGTFGAGAITYLRKKAGERLTGQIKNISGSALDWGTNNEPLAASHYEKVTGNTLQHIGFVQYDGEIGSINKGQVGGSPDGLVGSEGMVEIKCPFNTENHLLTIEKQEVPTQYMGQVQGGLWLNERKWCDFVSFDPRMQNPLHRIFILRVERDEEYIDKLIERFVLGNEYVEDRLQIIEIATQANAQKFYKKAQTSN